MSGLLPAPSSPLAAGLEPASLLDHILPHDLWRTGPLSISNHMLMLAASGVLLMVLMPLAARSASVVPHGFRNLVEAVLQFLREEVARPILGEHTDRYVPFLWTTFLFILTANLLGLVPVGMFAWTVDEHLAHMGGTATGNFSVTGGLAVCAFFFIHISGMREHGVAGYGKHFFFGHAPLWLAPLMIPLEIVGALVKPFALAIRLFANMIAGHIVLAAILAFAVIGIERAGAAYGITVVAIVGSVALSMLELFVAFLQAYVFTYLTTLFVGMAVVHEHEH